MLLDHFEQYIEDVRGIKEKTMKKYIGAIYAINDLLQSYSFPIQNLFNVKNSTEIEKVRIFLKENDEFLEKDLRGHRMYSVAFKHYARFVQWYFD